MRVLLAVDGSRPSYTACTLVSSLAWPTDTEIHVVGVVEPSSRSTEALLATQLDGVETTLTRPGLMVHRTLRHGRAATVVVDAAVDLEVDLVVLGSRGHGALRSMVLGSVSAEVVDHAPCPILVVRTAEVGDVLVATDGSSSAFEAVRFVTAASILAGHNVEVISVTRATDIGTSVLMPSIGGHALIASKEELAEEQDRAEGIVENATQRLRDAGYDVRATTTAGDPAHEIVEAAEAFGSGLIVLGSRGHTGLTRLVLGSVARNVLHHAAASVLIVRSPKAATAPAPF